ncbi:hypothetical protein VTK26DRAFT_3936 [Humicola hyalothermophila]
MYRARTNGAPVDVRQSTYFGHDREEVTRILIQALTDLGYQDAADNVSEASGFRVESPDVVAFRQAVLGGSWARAEELLCGRGSRNGNAQTPGNGGLVLAPGADRNMMKFRLRQQKFLELLERRDTGRALTVLRNELTPLCSEEHRTLHVLSRLLMCTDAEDLKSKANWDGANGRSRQALLEELSGSISPSVMLPDHRLAVLLDSVKRSQVEKCLYHTSNDPPSLYVNHTCDRRRFPTEVLAELSKPIADASKHEVWQIRFSPDGRRLASCGTEKPINIWDVERLTLIHELQGHSKGEIGEIAWSPDGKFLVSCGIDRYAKVWDTDTGDCVRVLERFGEPVSSCVWAADGKTFITGSFDKSKSLCEWDLRGECVHTWTKTHRTQDVALSPDQHWLVAMDEQRGLHVYDYGTREHLYDLTLNARPTSLAISRDSRHVLVNKTDNEALLIDLETRVTKQKFTGHSGGQFTIRSGFGGANESFVISGSEDGRVFIWHKMTGTLVLEAIAHLPRCNAAAWSPTDPCLFATCGDDNLVKIWSNANPVRGLHVGRSRHHSNGTGRNSRNSSQFSLDMWA